jgi:polyisoprenoid-binding protein YceI
MTANCKRLPVPMRALMRWTALALFVIPASASGQRVIADGVLREGTLSFDGHANVGDFTGTTSSVSGRLIGGSSLSAAQGWVEASVRSMTTRNDHRDRDMNSVLESTRYPTLRFDLAGVTTSGAEGGDSVEVTLHGTLTIHGVSRVVEMPGLLVFTPTTVAVRSQFPLDLRDYHVGGLTKFFGMLRMREGILVHVALVFETDTPGVAHGGAEHPAVPVSIPVPPPFPFFRRQ